MQARGFPYGQVGANRKVQKRADNILKSSRTTGFDLEWDRIHVYKKNDRT